MEVELARAFLMLAEELHFGRAAERLKIAQPPLTRMIKKLERSLQVELFERSTRKVSLTEEGLALIGPARTLVDASESATRAVKDVVEGKQGGIELGFAGASNIQHAVWLTREMKKQFPKIHVELHTSQFSHLGLERILDETLDVSIGRYSFLPADVSSFKFAREEVVLAVPSNHRLAGREAIDLTELSDEHWVILPGGFGNALSNVFTILTKSSGLDTSSRTVAPDSWTQVMLVNAGIGIALTLNTVANRITDPGVKFLRINRHDRFLHPEIIWKTSNQNPALHSLLSVVRQESKNQAAEARAE